VPAIARRAHALAQLSGDEALAAETNGLFMVSRVHAGKRVDLRALRRSAELMPDTADRPIEFSPSFSYATVLKALDRADEARTLLLRIRDRLAELGNDGPLAYVSTQLAENETNTGRPLDALPYVDDAVRYATQTGTLAPLAPAAYQRTLALVLAGRATEAREAASESVAQAERSGWPVGSVQTRCALGLLELSLGNVDEAARELRVLVEPATQPSVKARRLGDAVEALLAAGDLDVAAQALAELERLAAVSGRPTCAAAASRSRALLALARGDAATALPAAEESVGQFEYIDSRIELGRSLVVQGICERRMRRRAAARTTLARAVDVLDDAGAELFAGRARHELARIGGRRATQDLTPTEARIAELAAHGRRNREIAAELFVTEKTVEAALSRVYRKLGVRSRSELAGVGKL
jgi:DNA-binding CsgD family transcriptional regulator